MNFLSLDSILWQPQRHWHTLTTDPVDREL